MDNMSIELLLNDSFSKNASGYNAISTLNGQREFTLRIVFVVAMIVFSVAGFFGNFLIVLTIALVRELRSTRNAFLANLAVSDIVLVTIVVPFNIISVLEGGPYWHDRMTLCRFVASVCAPGCLSAIWSNTGVAFNRYIFICRNESYDRYFSPFKTILWITAIWVLSFAIHLPNHLGWGHNGYVEHFFLCTRETSLWTYSTFFSAVGIVLPLIISFFSYCRIYALVRTTKSARNQILGTEKSHIATVSGNVSDKGYENQSVLNNRITPVPVNENKKVKKEKTALRAEMLLVRTLFRSFAVFVVAWLPLAVLLMLPNLEGPTWVYLATVFLAHGSTATNSVLYFMTNETFRRGFRTVLEKIRAHCSGRRETQAVFASHGTSKGRRSSQVASSQTDDQKEQNVPHDNV